MGLSDEKLPETVIGCGYRVYNQFGYGFLESGYVGALAHACRKLGLQVERECCVPLYFDGEVVANYRVDLLVENQLIVEAKTRPEILPEDIKQLWNYLRCGRLERALLLNFGPQNLVFRRYHYPNTRKKNVPGRELFSALLCSFSSALF